MKTATFIEKSTESSKTVKRGIPWRLSFDLLKVGEVIEVEFGVGGITEDFKIINIFEELDILGSSESVTFWMEFAGKFFVPFDPEWSV
jgi:hypothetical protein